MPSKVAEQIELFPESHEKIEPIERLIARLYRLQQDRIELAHKEKHEREKLHAKLREHGFRPGKGYKRGKYVGWLEADEVKCKAKLLGPEEKAEED